MTPAGSAWLVERTGIAPTPPPRSRHSSRSVLDETSRPSAAEPPATVAFTPQGLAIGRHLVEVHDHLRAELAAVRDILQQVRNGAAGVGQARSLINEMTIRANDWTLGGYCQAHCLQLTQHHSLESDGIFPHLRRSQPGLVEVLDRLDAEHDTIHGVLDDIDAALVLLVQHPTDFGPITEAVDLLTDTLTSHFAYEERELIAPLALQGFFVGQVVVGPAGQFGSRRSG